jgi:hypothetical protein
MERRSSGLAKSVWHAAAEYLMCCIGFAKVLYPKVVSRKDAKAQSATAFIKEFSLRLCGTYFLHYLF